MTEISFFFTFWTKNFDFLFFDSDHLETYNAPIGPLEAEILSRCHFSETCWPDVVSTELALEKVFHENGCNSGTVGRTTLAQVAKRPWEQGLRARPFRWSLFLLISLSRFFYSKYLYFHRFWPKVIFQPRDQIFWLKWPPHRFMGQGPLQWCSSRSHWCPLSGLRPRIDPKIGNKMRGERRGKGFDEPIVVDW